LNGSCGTCGALIGNASLHKGWHAKVVAKQPKPCSACLVNLVTGTSKSGLCAPCRNLKRIKEKYSDPEQKKQLLAQRRKSRTKAALEAAAGHAFDVCNNCGSEFAIKPSCCNSPVKWMP